MADQPIPLGLPYPTHSKRHLHNGNDGSGVVPFTNIAGQIITAQITDLAVTNGKLAADAVTTDKILDGTIATGDLAANAVTQVGVAAPTTSAPTIASGTYATLAEMSVTLTTVGGPLLVYFDCVWYGDAANREVTFGVALDGAAEVHDRPQFDATGAVFRNSALVHLFTGVSAASHTITGRWKRSSGAGTITANTTQRALYVVELKR